MHILLRSLIAIALLCSLAGCAGRGITPDEKMTSIYDSDPRPTALSPFTMKVEPMERLLLVNFERDPDLHYIGLEPQVFDDEITGRGILVIAYRVDGKVDVYHQASLEVGHLDYGIVGAGLGELMETVFEESLFDIGPTGIDAHVSFVDRHGRRVLVRIEERGGRPTRPFSLLAPMGVAAVDPPSLPLIMLFDFYFVRRAGTQVTITIDQRLHAPDRLGFPIDGRRVYFLRYAADPFIVQINPGAQGGLEALFPDADLKAVAGGIDHIFVANEGHFELQSLRAAHAGREVEMQFSPPVPDIAALRDGARVVGSFRIVTDPLMGEIDGDYRVERRGDEIHVSMRPSGGWSPRPDRLSLRLLFFVARPFRAWPKTYLFQAMIRLEGDGAATISSGWERTG